MCGICGEVQYGGVSDPEARVRRMADVLAPRGPDAAGSFRQNGTVLAHRRLKIIDLTERAQQPMIDNHLGLGIVYNGTVYNYPALRADLEARGYRFFSSGDTEVVLKAYHAWGDACVERFNGMFAFAVWHRDSGAIVLARDRLGIKPLYYAERPGSFRFASSLPALLAGGDVDTEIDPVALHHYMTFHSIVPPPRTMLKGVRKLAPATVMTIQPDGTRRERVYWDLPFGAGEGERARDTSEWASELRRHLQNAVERRLVADVPVGVLLSGGLDSSLLVGLLAHAGQRGLNTFSIGFESLNGEEGDEFRYSDVVAERFGTAHHRIRVPSDRVLDSLESCVRAMSEPMVSHDCIGFYLLSREVSRHMRVVQSGQGADEIFAGYHWYPPLLDSPDATTDYARLFFDRPHDELLSAIDPAHRGRDHSTAFLTEHFARPGAAAPVDRALRIDATVMMDDPVKRVDNMTMAWGLEARVPFLDHELVEFAARVPPGLKIRSGGKHILKQVAREVIPAEVIDRPKGYFPVPALKYLRGAYLERVRSILEEPAARRRGLFDSGYVRALLSRPEEHLTPLRGSKLWQIALLEYWLQVHEVGP